MDADMASCCTLRAGGRAEALVKVSSCEELNWLLQWAVAEKIAWYIMGRGSNLLVAEQGYPGIIIRLQGEFNTCSYLSDEKCRNPVVRVGAGCTVAAFVSWCSRQGLSGVEFLAGIPGSVGGAVAMNAGAWGHETAECLQGLAVVDEQGVFFEIPAEDLLISYRSTAWKQGDFSGLIIVGADCVLQGSTHQEIAALCRQYIEQRRKKQPKGVASAGSFFKNPPGDSAGRLIDAAGLKGVRRGGAMISPVHANFLINAGGATANDIIALMQYVQEQVKQQFSVCLEPEVKILQG